MQIHLAQSNSLLDIYLLEINSLHTFKKKCESDATVPP